MKELKINIHELNDNIFIACSCGALISINVSDVRFRNEVITECDICRKEILVTEGGSICKQ